MNSKYTGLQVEALLDKVQGQYTKEEINALIGNYEKKAWMGTSAQYNALEQIEEDRMYLITDGTAPDGSNIVDLTQYYTKDEINELLTSKANTAHTHTLGDITDYTAPTYKTINGQSILGEGNITIEGGSGGALAMAVANEVWMMENSMYSILSPEGFASILWKDSKRAAEAADVMKITAVDLKELGLIEKIIREPEPVSLDNILEIADEMKKDIIHFIDENKKKSGEELANERYERFRSF